MNVVASEEAPCPLELSESVVQGQDIVCGYMNVPEEHAKPDGKTIRLIGLYALPDEYEALHEAVIMPVVDASAPIE